MQIQFSSQKHCATPGALAALDQTTYTPQLLLSRHFTCDWSEMDVYDQQQNHWALKNGARIFSAYVIDNIKFWVITEADRSVTTILLPSEY